MPIRVMKRTFLCWIVASLFAFLAIPPNHSSAASITYFNIVSNTDFKAVPYLIAGVDYVPDFNSDKAGSTRIEYWNLEYSTDDGATWVSPPDGTRVNTNYLWPFYLPIDPNLVSAKFRLIMDFDPLIGSRSHSEKVIGPYRILQPADPTNFAATANGDGTVTLKWDDNSNMESYYQLTRYGPEGTQTFTVDNTMDYRGQLSYTDKQTDKKKATLYSYKLNAIVDQYDLPVNLQMADAFTLVKTKVPISILEASRYELNTSVLKIIPEIYVPILGNPDKAVVTGVRLDRKELAMKTGESAALAAAVTPADAGNPKVKWSSNNAAVAEVDDAGRVTAKSAGTAIILVATEVGSFTDACLVTVTDKAAEPGQNDPGLPPGPGVPNDIGGHWAKDDILKAVNAGFTKGYPDGSFKPDRSVTRAEFAVMLMQGLKAENEGAELTFKDKNQIGFWAVRSVQQAVQREIISGYSDGAFRPNANITHAEMASMIVRAAGLDGADAPPPGLADEAEIPGWAKPSVFKALDIGIIIVSGLPDKRFEPMALTTRAEAASSIVRMLELGP